MTGTFRTNCKYYLLYYKKVIMVSVLAITLLIISGISAFALSTEAQNAGGLMPAIYGCIDDIFDTGMDIKDKVVVNFSDTAFTIGGVSVSNISSICTDVNQLAQSLALVFCFFTFAFQFSKMINVQGVAYELLIGKLLGLFIGIVLIAGGMRLCFNITNLGSAMADKIAITVSNEQTLQNIDDIKEELYNECGKTTATTWGKQLAENLSNTLKQASYLFQLFVPSLAAKIASGIVGFILWGRAFEIIIMAIFSPFAFMGAVDINQIEHSSSLRFIRNIAALSLQSCVILIAVTLCSQVQVEIISNSLGNGLSGVLGSVWDIVVIGFAQAGLCARSLQISKTLMGVG